MRRRKGGTKNPVGRRKPLAASCRRPWGPPSPQRRSCTRRRRRRLSPLPCRVHHLSGVLPGRTHPRVNAWGSHREDNVRAHRECGAPAGGTPPDAVDGEVPPHRRADRGERPRQMGYLPLRKSRNSLGGWWEFTDVNTPKKNVRPTRYFVRDRKWPPKTSEDLKNPICRRLSLQYN